MSANRKTQGRPTMVLRNVSSKDETTDINQNISKIKSKDDTPIIVNNTVRPPSPPRSGSPILIRAESPKNQIVSIDKVTSPSVNSTHTSTIEHPPSPNHRRSLSPTARTASISIVQQEITTPITASSIQAATPITTSESPKSQTRRMLAETAHRRGGPHVENILTESSIDIAESNNMIASSPVVISNKSPTAIKVSPTAIKVSNEKLPSPTNKSSPPVVMKPPSPVIKTITSPVKTRTRSTLIQNNNDMNTTLDRNISTRNVAPQPPNNPSVARTVTLKRTPLIRNEDKKINKVEEEEEEEESEESFDEDNSAHESEQEESHAPSPPIKKRRNFSPIHVAATAAPTVTASPTGAAVARGPAETVAAQSPAQGPTRPNYRAMDEDEQQRFRTEFNVKLSILRRSFPEYNFADFPETATLDAVHDIYAGYVKQVVIALNCSQYRIFLVIMFLALEAFGVKVLKLNMGGFTLVQMRTMNRYDSILIELGEKYYISGPSGWPAEMRLVFMAVMSAITFIVVKWLSSYIGGEAAMQPIQNAIEELMTGGFSMSNAASLPAGVPSIPTAASVATGAVATGVAATAAVAPAPAAGGGFDFMGMINGFMGGQGSEGIKDLIGKVGSTFINSNSQASAAVQATAAPAGAAPRRRPRFRAPTTETTKI